jgi:hypothetical protein
MDFVDLVKALSDFGGLGIVVAFVIWWSVRADKLRKEENDKRLIYDQQRLEIDRDIANTLGALAATIQNWKH